MAEAIGLASALAGLANLTLQIFTNLYQFYEDVRSAPARSDQLRTEVGSLLDLCKVLQDIVEVQNESLKTSLTEHINGFNATLNEMSLRTRPKNAKGVQRFKWCFKAYENMEYISRIERFKSSLNMILHMNETYNSQALKQTVFRISETLVEVKDYTDDIKDDTGIIKGHTHEIKDATSKLRKWQLDGEMRGILDTICPRTIDSDHEQQLRRSIATENTGLWIFDNQEYNTWLTSPGSFLWLHGRMGAGKTMLMSSIIDRVIKYGLGDISDTMNAVTFFYCDGNSQASISDSSTIFANILRQLLTTSLTEPEESFVEEVKARFKAKPNFLLSDILSSLEWMSSHFTEVYVIIDGIDECSDRETFCLSIRRLISVANMKLLVAGRPEQDIAASDAFHGKPTLSIDEAIKVDISTHVNWYIESDQKLCRKKEALKQDIENTLIEKSNGMFRWVQCQLEHIRTLRQESTVKKALEGLPPGLPETYERILERIGRVSSSDLKIARTALTWLVYCPRHFDIRSLAVASVIDPDGEFDEAMLLDNCDDILEICGSLIRMDPDTSIVDISHFSVREYWTSPFLPDGSQNVHFVDERQADSLLLRACFAYLGAPRLQQRHTQMRTLLEDDFFPSAALCWPYHAETISEEEDTAYLILSFLESASFNTWSIFWTGLPSHAHIFSGMTSHVARRHEFLALAKLKGPYRSVQQLGHQTPGPLYVATAFSFRKVANALLRKGSDPNHYGGISSYPLFAAVEKDNSELMKDLLSTGAVTNMTIPKQGTPLHVAVRLQHVGLVELLLEAGADINARDDSDRTPLMALLATYPVYPDWMVRRYQSAMDMDQQEPMIEMSQLLASRMTISQRKIHLDFALERGFTKIADVLLLGQGRFNLDLTDEGGNTFLHIMAMSGPIELAKQLIDSGANTVLLNRRGWSPLHAAAWARRPELMEILREFPTESETADALVYDITLPDQVMVQFEDDDNYIRYLLHLARTEPEDHIWPLVLANECYREASHSNAQPVHVVAAKLYEHSLHLNPRNKEAKRLEDVVHSLLCDYCLEEVQGRLWRCGSCWKQWCARCLVYEKDGFCRETFQSSRPFTHQLLNVPRVGWHPQTGFILQQNENVGTVDEYDSECSSEGATAAFLIAMECEFEELDELLKQLYEGDALQEEE